ncbi:hypothetical protein [Profundibacter sp.]
MIQIIRNFPARFGAGGLIYRHGQEIAGLVSVRGLDRIVEFDRKSVRQKELEYLMRADAWERAKRGEPGMLIK